MDPSKTSINTAKGNAGDAAAANGTPADTTDTSQSIARQMTHIAMAVSFYWVVSISMVFANKSLLGSTESAMKSAPFFITWSQCVVTVVFCYVMGGSRLLRMPKFEVQLPILRQILSLSLIFTCMIVFNNLCLKHVEVSFYQVARSLTIVFNVVFDFVVLRQITSMPAMGCCAMVVSGFVLGNAHEMRWSLFGVVFGVTSSFFVAMNSIFVKKKFSLVDNDPWKITLYNNINASFLFLPLILFSGELSTLYNSPQTYTLMYWVLLFMTGLLGVMISFATAAQIKYTSPLTHNVSATAKSAAQTVIALLVYRNPINVYGAMSIFIVLTASMLYTLVRRSEMKKKVAEESAAKDSNTDNVPLVAETTASKS